LSAALPSLLRARAGRVFWLAMKLAIAALSGLVVLLGVLLVAVGTDLRNRNALLRECQIREGAAAVEEARAITAKLEEQLAVARAAAASSSR
jgi:hypothetical protein